MRVTHCPVLAHVGFVFSGPMLGVLCLACSASDGGPPGGLGGAPATASGGAGDPLSTGGVFTGGAATGGTATGGFSSGGPGSGSSGGAARGGSDAGGPSSGGAETGGTGTGGSGTGGASTGGASTGGASTGGASTGGASTGGASTGGSGGSEPLPNVTLYVAGDSTVAAYTDTASTTDQAGWGQMLPEIFSDQVTVVNRAAGGRTALWFHLEGATTWILERIQPDDYFFIQFGTNDGHQTATFTVNGVTYPRYAAPSTDFKTHLKDYYLDPTRALGAIPVLVTPPPRNSAYCGRGNSLGAYAQAMRELGATENVIVLDLNSKTYEHLAAICPSPTPEDFFFIKADGSVDGTHFQENGARHMAGFLGECVEATGLGLESYLLP